MENNDVDFTEPPQQKNQKLRSYRIVCAKLGLIMCVYFICRLISIWAADLLNNASEILGSSMYRLLSTLIIIILVYIIPILFAATVFNSYETYKGNFRILYKKPRRLARALGTFPATFGLGHGVALLTLLISYLLSRFLGGETFIEDLLRPPIIEPPDTMLSILIMVFLLVIIAPVFEEFLTRGIMFDVLKPYGTGMAIIISSILFGLMHGSLNMLFYTTAYGFALGYIRYATGSLFTTTILHAIINGIGAVALLLSAFLQMTNEENMILNTINAIYLVAFLILIIVGVAVFFSKIPSMRKYKIENAWTDMSAGKKVACFFTSVPVIIMMILAFNEIAGYWLMNLFLRNFA